MSRPQPFGERSGWPAAAVPSVYLTPGTGSFTDFLSRAEPHLLPLTELPAGAAEVAPHGTTIVALTHPGGVVMAGDRRATMGNLIAQRDMEKVFIADSHSTIGIAGTAGLAVEMVRLFQLELEHYEKIEGVRLSLEGKANRLAVMVRGNLGAAMQGLAVVPLFAGVDESGRGRVFSYDVTGGRYEEHHYHAVGSGSLFARSALKKRYDAAGDLQTTVRAAVEALYDAADDDSATGGPDSVRRIYPVVVAVGAGGAVRWSQEAVAAVAEAVLADRRARPGG